MSRTFFKVDIQNFGLMEKKVNNCMDFNELEKKWHSCGGTVIIKTL